MSTVLGWEGVGGRLYYVYFPFVLCVFLGRIGCVRRTLAFRRSDAHAGGGTYMDVVKSTFCVFVNYRALVDALELHFGRCVLT